MSRFEQLRWRAELLALRHGLWLLPALLLMAASLAAWSWWVPQQEAALRQAMLQTPPPLERPAKAIVAAPLPSTADGVQRLFALAGQYNLRIAQADYRRQETGAVGRWQVQLPASGNYVQLRRFLRAAQAIPGVSLDELGLHRGGVGDVIEARLLFSVWYVPEGSR